MGLMDLVESVSGAEGAGMNGKVAGGLMQALDEHPGGLAGVMDSFRNNGMQEHVQNWASGAQPQATPEQIQTGLGGTGFIESVAAKAGVSPQTAQVALATLLPMVISHFTNNGQQAPPQSGFGGMASQILGRFI